MNINLLKILSSLRSKKYPQRQLFISIEQEYDEGPVTFQYSSEMENEADGIIPVIPLYIKGIFGNILNSWFKPSADIGIEGYEFMEEEKKVVPSKSNMLINLDEDWDQALIRQEEDSLSDVESNNDDGYGGFSIEFGDLKIDNDDRIGNIEDSASIGTFGIPAPPNFIDLETSSQESTKNPQEISPSQSPTSKSPSHKDLNIEKFSNLNIEGNTTSKYPSKYPLVQLQSSNATPSENNNSSNKMKPTPVTPRDDNKSRASNPPHNVNLNNDNSNSQITNSPGSDSKKKSFQKLSNKTLSDKFNNLIESSVYAPSKQDGGGEGP